MAQQSYTASATGAIDGPIDAGSGNTFRNFHVKVNSPAPDCTVALETSADDTEWDEQDRVTGPNWSSAALHHSRRYARVNVIYLGTGAPPLAAVLTYSA